MDEETKEALAVLVVAAAVAVVAIGAADERGGGMAETAKGSIWLVEGAGEPADEEGDAAEGRTATGS